MAASLTPVLGTVAWPVHPLLLGPVRHGTVLGVFSRAVVVGVPTDAGPRVVSLLARGAAAVPNGVRLTGAGVDLHGMRVGAQVATGAGWLRAGPLEVRVVRRWRSRVVRVQPDSAGVADLATASAAAERGVPEEAIRRLENALTRSPVDRRDDDLSAAVGGLVGLGRGLTPGGDDVLAGLLTGLHAVGRADLAATIGDRALHRITDRTTLLSADLLRLAAAGHACLEALAVLRAVHRSPSARELDGADSRVTAAIDRLLSIGHTSGADVATGLSLGLMVGLGSDREAAMVAAGQGAR